MSKESVKELKKTHWVKPLKMHDKLQIILEQCILAATRYAVHSGQKLAALW